MTLKIYGIARSRASRTLWMAHELVCRTTMSRPASRMAARRRLRSVLSIPTAAYPPSRMGALSFGNRLPSISISPSAMAARSLRDAVEDAHMTMWSVWTVSEIEPLAHDVYVHTITAPPNERDPAKAEAAVMRLQRPLEALEAALSNGNGFLVGRRFTVADLNAAAVMFYLRAMPEAIGHRPATLAWHRAATERPAFKTMLAMRDQG